MSHFSFIERAFSIPIFSISSELSRIPAVSTNLMVCPSIVISSSIVSRVVPGMFVTIARSSSNKAFKRDDFPAEVSNEIKTIYNSNKDTLVVYNKTDLSAEKNPLGAPSPIYISAKKHTGLSELKKAITASLHFETKDNIPLITKERHYTSLKTCLKSLDAAVKGIEQELSVEYISFDLREGLESLSEIIGINVTEEILGGIFSKFCVGK